MPQTSRDPGTGPGVRISASLRRAVAGSSVGEENYKWADFREAQSLPELEAQIVALQTALAKIQRTPLGMVEIWAGSRIPDGYALCEGQQLKQSEYPELYKAIGSTYNNAYDCNGRKLSTTSGYFRLPDLRGRFVVGYNVSDADYGSYGKVGGEKKHTLTVDEIPSHAHGRIFGPEVTAAGAAAAATLIPKPYRGMTARRLSEQRTARAAAVRTRTARPIIRWPMSCGRSKTLITRLQNGNQSTCAAAQMVRPGNVPDGRAVLGPLRQLLP